MMDFFRKHMRTIFLITIVGFIAATFVSFGGYSFGPKTAADSVVVVNGVGIPYREYRTRYNLAVENLRQNGKVDVTDQMLQQKRQEVLQDLVQEEVFWEQAKKFDITVTDAELAADIQNYPAFQIDGRFDRRAYYQMLGRVFRMTPQEFEQWRRRQIAVNKVRYFIASSVKISENELRFEYARANNGNMKNFEKDREEFLKRLRDQKIAMVFNEWLRLLNQTVKIKVNLDDIEKGTT